MSILIKGMDEMPEDGAVLVVRLDDNGKTYIKFACTYGYSMELVELPEEYEQMIEWYIRVTKAQPTVIEAEGEE